MAFIVSALLPVLLLIALGYGVKRIGLISDDAWVGLERIAYYVLFPAMLVFNLADQPLAGVPWRNMLFVIAPTCLAAAVVLVGWHLAVGSVSGATFTSIFQGGVRFNSYIALAVTEAFFGAEGLAVAAVAVSLMIVIVNLLSVAAFAVWGERSGRIGLRRLLRDVVGNPLILASAFGLLLGLGDRDLPGVALDSLGLIGRAALPVGLLAVGAAVKPEAIRGHWRPVLVSTLVQYGLKPLTAALLIGLSGLSDIAAGTIFIMFITPIASSSYILSRQLGGDAVTTTSIITVQTLLAFLTMPLAMSLVPGLP